MFLIMLISKGFLRHLQKWFQYNKWHNICEWHFILLPWIIQPSSLSFDAFDCVAKTEKYQLPLTSKVKVLGVFECVCPNWVAETHIQKKEAGKVVSGWASESVISIFCGFSFGSFWCPYVRCSTVSGDTHIKVCLSMINSGIMVDEMMKGAVFDVGNVLWKSVHLDLCTDIGGTVSCQTKMDL